MSDDIRERLFKPRLPEAEVEVEGIGTIRVRGLSRIEAMLVQKANGIAAMERTMLALAMVDPELTEAEVSRWQKASTAGELEPVTQKISELSGMTQESAKEAMRTFRDEPGDGVRVLPGAEAGDDGGPAAPGDE
jgi:hypothetical protein